MLADSFCYRAHSGTLSKEVHLAAASLYGLLDFIADELPRWRDRPEREQKTAENSLTSQLCAHLASAAANATGWDFLQFRIEEPDEQYNGRKIDLVAAPRAAIVWIDGRCCYDFHTLLPIECKRLPTPDGKNRDEREYVISGKSSTGGIQRFKAGHHAAEHTLAGMIGYVQEHTGAFWLDRITTWIKELDGTCAGWSFRDLLHTESDNPTTRLSIYHSTHTRKNDLSEIELRHLWIEMRPTDSLAP